MNKVAIVGHFGFGLECFDGQTIKTKNLADALKKYTGIQVLEIDTRGWKRHPLRLYKCIKSAFKDCDAVIMLPAHNGVKVFAPILSRFGKKYGKKIYYDVIGGWLSELLQGKDGLVKTLKGFDGIWVETQSMKSNLFKMGFENAVVVNNFKDLCPLTENELVYAEEAPFKLCTFSRVVKQKGIEEAVDAVKRVNEKLSFTAFTLDIYGAVSKEDREWFDKLRIKLDDACTYKGVIDSDKSVDVLKDYFALLFPTRYYTEGIPGTIIDAYCAGVPVICSRWKSYDDVVDEGICGIGYEFDNAKELEKVLLEIYEDKDSLLNMKKACLEKAQEYLSKGVIEKIQELID